MIATARLPLLLFLALLPLTLLARETEHGDVSLPTYLPSWAGEHPLQFVQRRLDEDDPVGARDAMARILDDLAESCTLLPPITSTRGPRSAVDSNELLLRRWFESLGKKGADLEVPSTRAELPIAPSSPLLWHPGQKEKARTCFEVAVATGDLSAALRILESPNAPLVNTDLREWLGRVSLEPPREAASPWRSSFPASESESHPLPDRFRRAYSATNIELPPARANTNSDTDRYGRRGPLSAIYPLFSNTHIMVTTGARALVLSHRGNPGVVLHQPFTGSEHGSLMHLPVQPVVSGDFIFTSARNHVREPEELDLFAYTFPDRRPQPLFNRPALFRIANGPPLSLKPVAIGLRKALHGYNVVGPAVFVDGRVYIPLCRGWRKARLTVACYDPAQDRIIWHRSIGSLRVKHHRATDFAGLLLETRLVPYGGDLVAVHAGGWIARVSRDTGELRGVLFYPRHTPFEDATASNDSFNRFLRLPPLRMRYPGPTTRVAGNDDHGPLLVMLPPDSRQLVAVDMERWRIHWRHENAEPQTMVLGSRHDRILVLDAATNAHESDLELRHLDMDTGRLTSRPLKLHLSVRIPHVPHVQVPGTEPILSGVPRLVGDEIWVPTLDALEVWKLAQGIEGARSADRTVRWPQGSIGGTPIPLPGGRVATVSRGDIELGTPSVLELFEGPEE